ncbi:MAG: hypothetical protein NT154_40160 [Verrucomicrobia bacterium]|nr:hypothetical protein [Verrucomicrobiota bacterium]
MPITSTHLPGRAWLGHNIFESSPWVCPRRLPGRHPALDIGIVKNLQQMALAWDMYLSDYRHKLVSAYPTGIINNVQQMMLAWVMYKSEYNNLLVTADP